MSLFTLKLHFLSEREIRYRSNRVYIWITMKRVRARSSAGEPADPLQAAEPQNTYRVTLLHCTALHTLLGQG